MAGRALAEGGMASAAGGAAGANALDELAGAAGASAGLSDDPLSGEGAVCAGYVAAWLAREAEYTSEETSCLECLGYNTDCGAAHRVVTEGQESCFRRHCLCDAADAGCEAAAGSCACFGRCLPNPPHPARRAWFDYMACEVEHCAAACQ